jgi:hypothetical protein
MAEVVLLKGAAARGLFMSANTSLPALMLMTLCVGLIIGIWQILAFLQRRGDRLATEHQLVASDHPVDRGVASGALPELAALGFIALMAMALLFVGHNSQGHVTATDEPNSAVQVQTGGMAADPTPAKPRANPAEHSNPPTSASTPPQPGSTPTTETGVGTTVNRPAGNDDQKR